MIKEELEKKAGDYAEKHAFRVPYDGSNKFYDDVDFKASKEGYLAGAKPREKRIEELETRCTELFLQNNEFAERFAKSTEIIKGLLTCCRNYPQENADKMKQAEQFLKGENIILEDAQAGNSPFDADEVFNKEMKAYTDEQFLELKEKKNAELKEKCNTLDKSLVTSTKNNIERQKIIDGLKEKNAVLERRIERAKECMRKLLFIINSDPANYNCKGLIQDAEDFIYNRTCNIRQQGEHCISETRCIMCDKEDGKVK